MAHHVPCRGIFCAGSLAVFATGRQVRGLNWATAKFLLELFEWHATSKLRPNLNASLHPINAGLCRLTKANGAFEALVLAELVSATGRGVMRAEDVGGATKSLRNFKTQIMSWFMYVHVYFRVLVLWEYGDAEES